MQGKRRQLGRPDWLRFAGAISLPERAAARVLGRVAGTLAPALDLLSASPLPDALKGRLRAHLEAATRALQET
ncbi:MAG: hypothetical protein D6729_11885 [Deltaproteobacteria bacterium]|nr:MAG: hypothetical protein D6729_11885 [Deltaproteobacteria bacterium]